MEDHNIDKLFKEKLENFKEVPDESVWGAISDSLNKRKKKRVLPIWWGWAGVAALFVLGLLLFNPIGEDIPDGVEVSDTENIARPDAEATAGSSETENFPEESGANPENTVVDSETATSNSANDKSSTAGEPESGLANQNAANSDTLQEENAVAVTANKKQAETKALSIDDSPVADNTNNPDSIKEGENSETDPSSNVRTDNELPQVTEEAIAENTEEVPETAKKSIFDEIEEAEEEIEVADSKKWSLGPSVAPVYFDALGTGSPVGSQLAGNDKSGTVSMSYGLTVAYSLSSKWEVRTGVHKVDYGYNTDDIAFTSAFSGTGGGLENIDYVPTSTNLVVQPQAAKVDNGLLAQSDDVEAQLPTRDGRMVQEIGYMEIPLEVSYKILDRKLGLKVIGGMSSLFLLDNNVTLESQGSTLQVGEATNINTTNFSTNLGVGISYKAAKNVEVNVEPVVKYQLNTFSNVSGNFQPYTLGVYSGLIYKF